MKTKMQKVVFTFHTTAAAMAMEKRCRQAGAPGRLLPTPREVSADCGMCWCAPVTERETVAHIAEQNAIEIEGVYELML